MSKERKIGNLKSKKILIIVVILIGIIVGSILIRNVIVNKRAEEEKYKLGENTSSSLIAKYIRKGVKIGGITGTLEVLDTSDATAKAEDILYGKTAYVNGVKIEGTLREKTVFEVEGVTIPLGFYYVGGTKKDGIVISDNIEDENKYKEQTEEGNSQISGDGLLGNQFVWVPVEDIGDFKTYPSYSGNLIQPITNFYEPSKEGYRYPNEVEEYSQMKQSIEINKGFYVARYEAGKENIDGVDTVVSKKGAMVWNYITWGESMTSIGTEGAVAKAKGMYTGKSGYGVTSTLIYGTEWDAIMAWIDPKYKISNCEDDSFVKKSDGKGNYADSDDSNNPDTCGANDAYRVNNIYDLAGNVWEWTMESYLTYSKVIRGGVYSGTGYDNPASDRYDNRPDNDDYPSIGFRVALYL